MTSRRNFIKVSGLAGGGLAFSLTIPSYGKVGLEPEKEAQIEFNKFLTINSSGTITIMLTKHEMGQGTGTSIPMIIADELDADWSKVVIKKSDYDPKYTMEEMGSTGGSSSIENLWDIARRTGATAREMLRQAAATHWKIDPMTVQIKSSLAINPATDEQLTFGELAEVASKIPNPEDVELKKPKEFVYIGKAVKNKLTDDIILGKAKYGIDMDVPGMVYASIEKCPVYKGKIKNFNDTKARKIAGVLDVFSIIPEGISSWQHVQEGVVVVADSSWTAFKARKLLKIEWEKGENANRSISSLQEEMISAKEKAEKSFEIGEFEKEALNEQNEILDVEYNNPHQTHALMEPLNATVHFKGDSCEVWTGTQNGGIVNGQVSKIVGLPRDKVTVHVLNSGGSFGRRYADPAIEAAFVSKRINKPVKILWSREDEVMHDYFHPYLRNYMKAIISPDKKVLGLENKAICTIDYVIWSNKWDHHYAIPNIQCYRSHVPSMIHIGAWRSVGEHLSALSRECFIDELANKISMNPIDYRIQLLSNEVDWGNPETLPTWVVDYFLPRKSTFRKNQLHVLNFIKSNNLWSTEMVQGRGKGFALSLFGETACAEIVEVSTDDSIRGFKVDKVTAVVFCGLVVNPHFAKGQIEGAIIWALTAALYGGLEVENGVVQRTNFHNNKVLRIDETPEIEVHFIESEEAPSGLGEPGTPPLAPALLNAIFNASGKRIRKIPVKKEDVLG